MHVVVLGRLVVVAADALLTVDRLGEEVERAGVGAGAVQAQRSSSGSGSPVSASSPSSLRLVTVEPLFQSCLSCSVGQAGDLIAGLMTTAMPSDGDLQLLVCDAVLLAGGDLFLGSIGREASEMSVSPAQNFSKPPPVPDCPTVMFTSGFSSLNRSAARLRRTGRPCSSRRC